MLRLAIGGGPVTDASVAPIPASEWVWCGYAGHFIAAQDCRFHLNTRVGRYRISTLGDYWPDGARKPEQIGVNRYYETLIFKVEGHGEHGEGEVCHWSEVDSFGYQTAVEAEEEHLALCLRYAEWGER